MNKNEQNRMVAWRLKLLRQVNDLPRGVAQTCRHFGLLAKPSTNGELGKRPTATPAYAIVPERLFIALGQPLARLFPRSCICESATDLVRLGLPAICIASTTLTWHALPCIAF
jgi:hypothetical protein